MKSLISFIMMVITSNSYSSLVIIHHENKLIQAHLVREIFENKYQIPNSLIDIRYGSCGNRVKSIQKLNLCIDKRGELLKLSSSEFIFKTLNSFFN